MRRFTASDGTKFFYNGDLSGDVRISCANGEDADVSGMALLDFVAEYVRGARIAALEQMATQALLGLPGQETP